MIDAELPKVREFINALFSSDYSIPENVMNLFLGTEPEKALCTLLSLFQEDVDKNPQMDCSPVIKGMMLGIAMTRCKPAALDHLIECVKEGERQAASVKTNYKH